MDKKESHKTALWLDNTGLHSAARCLEGTARGQIDVRGLLQLATELIFVDSLALSAFESEGVRSRSASIRDRLIHMGLDPEAFSVEPFTTVEFGAACESAAERFADTFRFTAVSFPVRDETVIHATKPDLTPQEKRGEESVYYLLSESWSAEQLEEIAQTALERKAAGATIYMLIKCSKLWEQARHTARSENWTEATTAQMVSALRYYLNQELAKLKMSMYAPAVARAEVFRENIVTISQRLGQLAEDAAKSLRPTSIGTPSVSGALVERSKGSPNGIISEALYFREMAKPLRERIATRLGKYAPGSPDWYFEADAEIRELSDHLQKELRLKKQPHWVDSLELHLGLPPLTVNVQALREWREFEKARRDITVLTEMSKRIAYSHSQQTFLEKLEGRCSQQE